ncbi:M48 family metalloprotease [Clostridium felsineum]|uniref:M56 family metallopeptidase n=1 Tax=Clostridium felsineum TaxID=36839 RepID=UPI00214DE1E3|nr:M56 family metallopeptidase [Clostridium felsineum]MCR3757525.1 M48 family metalloprotease [Clostridium felsineum]
MHIILSLFIETLRLSIMAAVAALIIWVIKLVLKNRMSPTWHYYIWLIILIRLILPYSLSSPVSIYNTVNIDRSVSKNIINSNNTQMISNQTTSYIKVNSNNDFIKDKKQDILQILSVVWIVGIVIGVVYLFSVYLIFYSKIRKEPEYREVEICDLLEECKKEMKIKRNIQIKKSQSVKTPCITGFIKPCILLPDYIAYKLTKEEIKYVIIHELSHFKHKDIIINWISILLNLIHWFNPILYFSFKKLKQDSEIACDAKALSYIKSGERKEYGKTIINLIAIISTFDVKPWEVAMVNKSEIKRRIIMISKFKKRRIVGTIVGVLLVGAVGVSVLTNERSLGIGSNKIAETKANTKVTNKEAVSKKDTDKKDSKVGLETTNQDVKQANAGASTNANIAQNNTKRQNETASIQNNANKKSLPNSSSSKPTTENTAKTTDNTKTDANTNTKNNQSEYTPQQAAIVAINYGQDSKNRISSVTESQGGDGYANFSNGDIGATVFTNTVTMNGKDCYTIRLASKSMRASGGTGTIGILHVAKDGTVYNN